MVVNIFVEKSYKYRFYPTQKQIEILEKTFGCCRFVYNYYLNQTSTNRERMFKGYNFWAVDLTRLKHDELYHFLSDVDATALQSSLRVLDRAYSAFFNGLKNGQKNGYPKFKSKRGKQSYTIKNNKTIKLFDNKIKIPKVGLLKTKISRLPEGRILSATISRNPSGKYFISLCCRIDVIEKTVQHPSSSIGIDLGLKHFIVMSNGQVIECPKYLREADAKIRKLHRKLSRQQYNSANYQKTRRKLSATYEYMVNTRKDFLHKISTNIVRKYDIMCIETLAIKNMSHNHHLAKSIMDAAWGIFVEQLCYKAQWQNKTVVCIPTNYASSQTCHICKNKNPITKNLDVRSWTCPECGSVLDRDMNAAINILNEGIRIYNS